MNGALERTALAIAVVAGAAAGARAAQPALSYDAYARVLKARVDAHGLVDYAGLKRDRADLDRFVDALARLDQADHQKWPEAARIAFWLNAYNALTLRAVVDHYPIKPTPIRSLVYPKNSIRQIPGVWDKIRFTVMGQALTLDAIEHGILRARFNEPRIHAALVCAAVSCPPLRAEPFAPDRLDAQFTDQARAFLASPNGLHVDREEKKIEVSRIFTWFGGDFIKAYGSDKRSEPTDPIKRAALSFLSRYASPDVRPILIDTSYQLTYLPYDWSLNEQPRKP